MILEYSIGDIKDIYDEEYYKNDDKDANDGDDANYEQNLKEDSDNIVCMEKIVSDKIDEYNINCKIHHIFPITISLSAIILLSSYIIL